MDFKGMKTKNQNQINPNVFALALTTGTMSRELLFQITKPTKP